MVFGAIILLYWSSTIIIPGSSYNLESGLGLVILPTPQPLVIGVLGFSHSLTLPFFVLDVI